MGSPSSTPSEQPPAWLAHRDQSWFNRRYNQPHIICIATLTDFLSDSNDRVVTDDSYPHLGPHIVTGRSGHLIPLRRAHLEKIDVCALFWNCCLFASVHFSDCFALPSLLSFTLLSLDLCRTLPIFIHLMRLCVRVCVCVCVCVSACVCLLVCVCSYTNSPC